MLISLVNPEYIRTRWNCPWRDDHDDEDEELEGGYDRIILDPFGDVRLYVRGGATAEALLSAIEHVVLDYTYLSEGSKQFRSLLKAPKPRYRLPARYEDANIETRVHTSFHLSRPGAIQLHCPEMISLEHRPFGETHYLTLKICNIPVGKALGEAVTRLLPADHAEREWAFHNPNNWCPRERKASQ